MSKIIILASSQIQYNNAKSYIDSHLKQDYSLSVWKFQPFLIYKDDFSRTKEIPAISKNKSLIRHICFLLRIAFLSVKSRNRIQILIVGEVSARYMRLIIYLINPTKIVFVDDGVKSIFTIPKYKFYFTPLFNLRKRILSRTTIYTKYNLLNSETETIIFNENKAKVKIDQIEDEIWFIGQPLHELSSSVDNKALELIESVLKKNKKVKYFLHRREVSIKKVAPMYNNLVFIEHNIPFEEYICKMTILPSQIYGFYSTALFFAHEHYRHIININALYLNINNNTDMVYEFFEKNNLKVIRK